MPTMIASWKEIEIGKEEDVEEGRVSMIRLEMNVGCPVSSGNRGSHTCREIA